MDDQARAQQGAGQPAGPELTIPILRVHYKQDQNGVRQVQGVELGGSLLGNVVSINAGFDAGKPGTLPGNVVRCTMEVLWPVEWVDVNRGPDLVVARSVPPAFPR